MQKCAICGLEENKVALFEGISIGEMVRVCEPCAEEEGIPMLKKPSSVQLEQADDHKSVRERMERLSGMRKTTALSDEGSNSQALRARLKAPPKTEQNENVVPNYHWNLTLARRRRKLTLSQVAKATGVPQAALAAIERGKIPKDFEDLFIKLEGYFKIQLLNERPKKISFVRRDEETQERILDAVRDKIDGGEVLSEDEPPKIEKAPRITLSGLIERKRARDKKKKEAKEREKEEAMIGDDIDLDLDLSEESN